MAEPSPERKRKKSREIFARGERVLVGGVNSPVRSFRSVGGEPLIVERAEGAHLHDVDGNELIDFVGSWGAMIAGHAHPAVTAGVAEQARRGTSYGVTNELEIELAETITAALPSVERIRFVSSGTEATIARGSRIHKARFHREIRGVLSRTFRQLSFPGRLGTGDAGDCVQSRSSPEFCGTDA